jgi:hypothetical protein
MRLHPGEFTYLPDLEKELFRDCYGRTTHNPVMTNVLPGEVCRTES